MRGPGAQSPRLRRRSAEEEEELRRIVRTAERQTHARDVLRQSGPAQPLAGTVPVLQGDDQVTRQELYAQLWLFADPLPSPLEAVTGITHKNLWHPEPRLQEPVQALGTRKIYYLKQLEDIMDAAAAPGAPELPFTRLFPNLQFLEGPVRVLDDRAKRWYMENLGIDSTLKLYVKHILNWHDGEVRLMGDFQWETFPATGGDQVVPGGFTVFHPHLWHYQYMKSPETRAWLLWRKTSPWKLHDLRPQDVAWVLAKEGNETTYVKFVPAPGGSPAAGENQNLGPGTFYVKQGHLVTLAEMLRFGSHVCTCFDIYRTFVHLPIFVYKRAHSSSQSEPGMKRKAAKLLRHEETGRYGLPAYRW